MLNYLVRYCIFPSKQYTISSTKWPAKDYELILGEKANMTYRNDPLNYDRYVATALNVSVEAQTAFGTIKESFASNFLKVIFFFFL